MAEAGIKISNLTNVTPKQNGSDYTVLVQDGITRRTYISALADLFNGGATTDIDGLRRYVYNDLSPRTNTISVDLKTLSVNVKLSCENLGEEIHTLGDTVDETSRTIEEVKTEFESLSHKLDDLSDLIDDPDMLSSLTSMIKLLSGEDGQASLLNLTNGIIAISNDLEITKNTLEYNVIPVVNEASASIDNIFDDNFNTEKFSNENNSLLATELNNNYDFSYDKNSFANISVNSSKFLEAILSGKDTTTEEEKTFTLTAAIPSIEDLEENYYTGIMAIENVGTLSNVSMISSLQRVNEANVCRQICADYTLEVSDDPEPTIRQNIIAEEFISFPGDETFSLNMIPIRGGMFKKDDDSYKFVLRTRLSGNSEVNLYYANNAKIVEEQDCKVDIFVDNEKIARKNALTSETTDDTNLELITKQKIKGGKTISFEIDFGDANPYTVNSNNHNVVAGIYAKRLPSDSKPLQIHNLTAWTEFTIDGNQEVINPTKIKCNLVGGVTGDTYNLSVLYKYSDDEQQVATIKYDSPTQSSIDIDNTIFNNVKEIYLASEKLSAGCEVTLYMQKSDDPSNVTSASFQITGYTEIN